MDVFAMQEICPYEVAAFGYSNFCGLFTKQEWINFDYGISRRLYREFFSENPTDRAQGIGYVQELLARLKNEYLFVSHTSVDSTLDNNPTTFPLGQPFYLDMTHDSTISTVLLALGLDYFKGPPTGLPYNIPHAPNPPKHFRVSDIAPFGARLYTEVLTCSTPNPKVNKGHRRAIYSNLNIRNGWTFIRMLLNEKPLPLHTLGCPYRSDGLCSLKDFLATQEESTAKAQYATACFGNYVVNEPITSQAANGNLDDCPKKCHNWRKLMLELLFNKYLLSSQLV
ncbi:unnamed protein product [Rotaria sp. Silwood1]|nr:unnamed protein product [Rotaria sp. Silwood1]CAF1566779.1 unnamed protein product [Rotaria sp. Silwood1]